MYSFRNDYSEGAHPAVLRLLSDTNLEQTCGYGEDPYCRKAAALIQELCRAPQAAVHFLVGGTQTNLVAADALLRPFEAVIAAASGHVSTHETGAIEALGHKVCTVDAPDGKLTAELVESVVAAHHSEHMVQPRLVYLSNTTELGTVYTKAELQALRRCCEQHGLLLYIDGARLGSALACPAAGLDFADLAELADAFSIGGTKNGALLGEALVIVNPAFQERFRWYMKRRGALLAKGRILGIQFLALLEDGLYLRLAQHANELALTLRAGMERLGYTMMTDSPSNQQFPLLPPSVVEQLRQLGYEFEIDHTRPDGAVCIRLVTSWATPEQAVEDFLRDLARC